MYRQRIMRFFLIEKLGLKQTSFLGEVSSDIGMGLDRMGVILLKSIFIAINLCEKGLFWKRSGNSGLIKEKTFNYKVLSF